MNKEQYLEMKRKIDRPVIFGFKKSDIKTACLLLWYIAIAIAGTGWFFGGFWLFWLVFGI